MASEELTIINQERVAHAEKLAQRRTEQRQEDQERHERHLEEVERERRRAREEQGRIVEREV
jgi:hypothetical protein